VVCTNFAFGSAFDKISAMNKDASRILEEALKLPIEARAALAGSLIESLDEVIDDNVEAAWAEEIAQRVADLDSGKAKTIPWSKARRLILSR
jgi:putative addiction module component (TIGR02574 family)